MAQQPMQHNTAATPQQRAAPQTTIPAQRPVQQQTQKPTTPPSMPPSPPGKTPATGQPATTMPPTKKSIFKEWWFWLIIGLGIVIILLAVWFIFF